MQNEFIRKNGVKRELAIINLLMQKAIGLRKEEMIFMLYTVVPLERIYVDQRAKAQANKEDAEPEYREVFLKHGRVVARRDGEGYVVQKINSTDMTDYLNAEYSPGKNIKPLA